ncbi:MAG TPA: DUF5989 family protein [Anaerohalosphaeraceae bacterium]|nr:DUF5989 family protein [Anaerohalosphaeraceae bacterium]
MSKLAIIKELLSFLIQQKKWWLIPIVVMLLLIGAMIVFTQGSILSPLIYALF